MGLKKETTKAEEILTKQGRPKHPYHPETIWYDSDYTARRKEFEQIHIEYQECLETWRSDKSNSLQADILWHIKQGTMGKCGTVIWDSVAEENNDWQPYQVNQFRLYRYHKWRLSNMSEEERQQEQGRSRKISGSIRSTLLSLINNSKVKR